MPRATTYDEVMSGRDIGQWVRLSGIVREAHIDPAQIPPRLLVDIASSGGRRFRSWILNYDGIDPARLVDARVSVTGVPFPLSNNDGRIFNFRVLASSPADIVVERPSAENPYDSAIVPLENFRRGRPDAEAGHRIHVRGTVTGAQPGRWIALTDGTGFLQFRTAQRMPRLQPGDLIDALGFPASGEFGAVLEDAVFQRRGNGTPTPPVQQVTISTALESDSRLISIEAIFLGSAVRPDAFLLTMQSGETLFETNLATDDHSWPWQDLKPGCQVRVTGICTVSAGDDVRYLLDLTPQSFRIALRDASDLQILQHPPWLTSQRAKILLASLTVGALLLLLHQRTLRIEMKGR
ncbi:MAG: hypothetical protein EOP84_32140, partial [Verrucomicrobiaceae bacterium]